MAHSAVAAVHQYHTRPPTLASTFCFRSSPLVHDAAAMEALNLNPGAPRVDHRARAAFEEFKAREAADKAKRE